MRRFTARRSHRTGTGADRRGRGAVRSAVACLAAGMLALTACTSGPEPGEGGGGNRALIAYIQEAGGMNPLFHDQSGAFLGAFAQEPLFIERADGEVEPFLAAEIPTAENGGVSKDGKTVTYKLRDDVTWSDGEPFTAHDLEFTFEAFNDPESAILVPSEYDLVKSVEAKDDQTAVVTMKAPNGTYLSLWKNVLAKHKFDSTAITKEHEQAQLPLGTGPFVFKEIKEGDRIVLDRNKNYWRDPKLPKLDGITLKVTPEAESAISGFIAGEYDTVFFVTTGDLPDLVKAQEEDGAPIKVATQKTRSHVEWLWLNHSNKGDRKAGHPVLSDPAIREAIDLGIDRQQIIDKALGGYGTLEGSAIYAGTYAVHKKPAPFDQAEAKKVLDAAGWKPGDDGVRTKDGVRASLKFQTISGDPVRSRYQQMIQQDLKKIGVEVKIENVPSNTMFGGYSDGGLLATGNFDMMMSRDGYYRDPVEWIDMFTCDSIPDKQNPDRITTSHWCDPSFDKRVAQAASTIDQKERAQLYRQLADQFAEERVALPLYSSTWGWTWNERLTGVSTDYFDGIWRGTAQWQIKE